MDRNERPDTGDFACTHCGAVYEKLETPAHDTGSAKCEVCNMIMMKWVDAAIPLFRAKKNVRQSLNSWVDDQPNSAWSWVSRFN
jgi:hypothetical protein